MTTDDFNPVTDLTMDMAEGVEPFPFVEDENASISGYGHQDKAKFAAEVNRYDDYCNGGPFLDDARWTADDIGHKWASFDGEHFAPVNPGTPGAVPLTTLWGQR